VVGNSPRQGGDGEKTSWRRRFFKRSGISDIHVWRGGVSRWHEILALGGSSKGRHASRKSGGLVLL